jgi:transcriptional regulator with XRE-family HTH domain
MSTMPIDFGMDDKPDIKILMLTAKVTQQELAKRLGIGQPALSQMLNPKANPTLKTLRRLSRELGVPLETLAATYDDPDDDRGGDDTNN